MTTWHVRWLPLLWAGSLFCGPVPFSVGRLPFLWERAPIPSGRRDFTVGGDREHRLDLAGLRVFVVEDEALVLLTLEDMLADLGCEVVVAVQQIEEALRLAFDVAVDVALLDVNVGGTRIDPVAHIFATRGIPRFPSTRRAMAGATRSFSPM